jgi:hypothetical protein
MSTAWDVLPSEPISWYARFVAYRDLGPKRSLLAAYYADAPARAARDIPQAWRDAHERWHWRERAIAWDNAQNDATRRNREQQRASERQDRVTLLRATRAKLITALSKTDAQAPEFSELTVNITRLNEQMRQEAEID